MKVDRMRDGLLKPRTRKALAGLAAAVVLGVGTVTSLAAWQDHSYLNGTVGTGKFFIQVSVDGGTTWIGATASGSPTTGVVFDLPSNASALVPGGGLKTYVLVRAGAGSMGGNLSVGQPTGIIDGGGATSTLLANNLTYSIYGAPAKSYNDGATAVSGDATGMSKTDCQGTLAGVAVTNNFLSATPLASAATSGTAPTPTGSIALPAGTSGAAGPAKALCFQLTLNTTLTNAVPSTPGSLGSLSINPTWPLNASI